MSEKEEGNQATREAGHLISPERTRNKNESCEAAADAKRTVFMSEKEEGRQAQAHGNRGTICQKRKSKNIIPASADRPFWKVS
ncbi:MAG: hypothetical protein IKH28_03170 [Lachnospiraceae bacterium]|nr:hypothetical protein [Lachnospiraceae bacterium]